MVLRNCVILQGGGSWPDMGNLQDCKNVVVSSYKMPHQNSPSICCCSTILHLHILKTTVTNQSNFWTTAGLGVLEMVLDVLRHFSLWFLDGSKLFWVVVGISMWFYKVLSCS